MTLRKCKKQWIGNDGLTHFCDIRPRSHEGDHRCPCGETLRVHKEKIFIGRGTHGQN